MIGEPYLLLDKRASRINLILNKNKFIKDLLKIVDKDKPKLKSYVIRDLTRNYVYNPREGRQRYGGLRYGSVEEPTTDEEPTTVEPKFSDMTPSQINDMYTALVIGWVTNSYLSEFNEITRIIVSCCSNKYVVSKLEKQLHHVHWKSFSTNKCAVYILEENLDKVDWEILSLNENAIHLLIKLDTNKMKENMKTFAEELVSYVFHPVRLNRIATRLGMDLDDLLDTF